jgi:hypothetical protein
METEMEIAAGTMILEISPLPHPPRPPQKKNQKQPKKTKKITSGLLLPNKTIELSIDRCDFDLI